jgi:predicted RND superfamily exporter protein
VLLLVLGFRALAPFALLMVLLTTGTLGTLVIQNLLFGGVNMIATAGALAIVGIGSDYGVVFLLAYQRELEATARERERTAACCASSGCARCASPSRARSPRSAAPPPSAASSRRRRSSRWPAPT